MKQIELNIIESFNLAKKDIRELARRIGELERVLDAVVKIGEKPKVITQTRVVRKIVRQKPSPVKYVASRNGLRYHAQNCVFAKNINTENRIVSRTKASLKSKGYSACDCVK